LWILFEFFVGLYWITMPPKKVPTVATSYVAKCSRCGKKHGPPLHKACLSLQVIDEDEREGQDEQPEGDLVNQQTGDDLPDAPENPTGEVNVGSDQAAAAATIADPVVVQLANMAAAITSLETMYKET
jgi:hypothetical protein